jgi:mannose-6-phosphate isomerase-like protein (cupin superfamily)
MMGAREAFERCLTELRALHAACPAIARFAPLPDSLAEQPVTPHDIPAARLMEADEGLFSDGFEAMRDAFIAASPHAQWRETYKGTRMGPDFMNRFACYCLIGGGGPYVSDSLGAYVVYMPPGLFYPYHHHPAEELYFILAGEAEFLMEGAPSKTLRPGDHVLHPSNRPHATCTHAHPFMALVLWRGNMSVKPVLTHPDGEP